MKRSVVKLSVYFVCLQVLLALSVWAGAAEEIDLTQVPFPVLVLDSPAITIDGSFADWPEVLPAKLFHDSQITAGSRTPQNDFSGTVWTVFDKHNVYFAADLHDRSPLLNGQQQSNIWQGDTLEIYLGFHEGSRNFLGDGDFQLGITLLPENQTFWNWPQGKAVENYELVVVPTKSGCRLEAKLPLEELGKASVSAGETVWLDFAIDNASSAIGGRKAQLTWNGDGNNYQNAALWRKSVLTGNSADLDALVVTGPALFPFKRPAFLQLFAGKQAWQGNLQIGKQTYSTDEEGKIAFLEKENKALILNLEFEGTQYRQQLFSNRRDRRKFLRGVAKKADLNPIPADAVYKNAEASIEERVNDLLAYMTLEEKIGQMAQVARDYILDIEDISDFGFGSILSGGGSGPEQNTPEAWVAMYNSYQEIALDTRLGIPLIYGIDAVHGHNNVKGATIFPHNIGLGATGDPQLVEEIARATAVEVSATGIDWTFAPCIAVPRDERWGRTYEGFSEDPELTATLGAAAVRGYQGSDLADPLTILATAKHYAGDGGTHGGKDQGDTVMTEKEFRAIHIRPYQDAIEAGSGSIMASFSSWNGEKIHGHRYLLTDVLRDEMQFEGFIVSDWAAVKQLPGTPKEQLEAVINAGIDMVMIPDDYMQFISVLSALVKEGLVSEARIDEAVRKILTAKFALGLFETPLADTSLVEKIGAQEHRDLARDAVRKSLVLLKNNGILPLSKDALHIHVAGKLSKDIGSQCGGWTIAWQGSTGKITEGATIYDAIKQTVSSDTKVSYSRNGKSKKAADADAIVVVIGEEPYAEFKGDSETLGLSQREKNTIANAKASGLPMVVVLLSGRPLLINEELEQADAFIAAWLPGTEGQGVADILFGDYAPTGKLSYTWPRSLEQLPINLGDGQDDPLFPFGFGLSYE